MTKRFEDEDWSGASFHNINFSGARIQEANLDGASFSGFVGSMTVNGVRIWPLIAAELARLHPERAKLRPDDAAGCREALDTVDAQLEETISRARKLTGMQQRERVNDEWSATQTVQHLVYVIDKWLGHIIKGVEQLHPIGLPNTADGFNPVDPGADPTFDEAVEVWASRKGQLRAFLADPDLDATTAHYDMPVRDALHVIFDELWWHNQYMARDLSILEGAS